MLPDACVSVPVWAAAHVFPIRKVCGRLPDFCWTGKTELIWCDLEKSFDAEALQINPPDAIWSAFNCSFISYKCVLKVVVSQRSDVEAVCGSV